MFGDQRFDPFGKPQPGSRRMGNWHRVQQTARHRHRIGQGIDRLDRHNFLIEISQRIGFDAIQILPIAQGQYGCRFINAPGERRVGGKAHAFHLIEGSAALPRQHLDVQ